ncbi:hypothetical protein [Oceanibium sediminis]|uniref:hypothetical protein n=1 Tax=Oceanibium sediminis TaxID=2026339 RepID=UPI000DD3F40A|nr:hypothetical protein [Oceanibium sediminis]
MQAAALDRALLQAHAVGDPVALARLYTLAGDLAEARGDIDAACFYLTHAFVFALQAGSADSGTLNHRLWQHGREEPCLQEHMT